VWGGAAQQQHPQLPTSPPPPTLSVLQAHGSPATPATPPTGGIASETLLFDDDDELDLPM
jgi:hypothetical protein